MFTTSVPRLVPLSNLARTLGRTSRYSTITRSRATNLVEALKEYAYKTPKAPLLHVAGEAFSYERLDRDSDAFALALSTLFGVQRGTVVLAITPSTPNMLTLQLSCAKIGAYIAPLFTGFIRVEFKASINNCQPRAVFCHPHFKPLLLDMVAAGDINVDPKAILTLEELEEISREFRGKSVEIQTSRNCTITFTSGSTGRPKGVFVAQDVLFERTRSFYPPHPPSAVAYVPGFPGAISQSMYLAWALVHGSSICYPEIPKNHYSLTIEDVMKQLSSGIQADLITDAQFFGYQVNWATHNQESFGEGTRRKLKRVVYGGLKFPTATIEKMLDLFPCTDFYQVYGMTELCGGATTLGPEEHRARTRLASAGKCDLRQVRIIRDDIEEEEGDPNAPLGFNQPGQVCFHKSMTTEGYINEPDSTATLFSGDWMKTGDSGKICEDGYLWILDRQKDKIIDSMGYTTYTPEVEDILARLPGVREVLVVGVPTEFGAIVKACIIPDKSIDEGRNLTREQVLEHSEKNMAKYKIPKIVEFLDEFPRTISGKVKKTLLRYDPEKKVKELQAE